MTLGPVQHLFQDVLTPSPQGPAGQDVTLGMRFKVNAAGQVGGLRFWRLAGATMLSRPLTLWRADGTRLARVITTAEAGSGWVSVPLPAPVPVAAGEVLWCAKGADPTSTYSNLTGVPPSASANLVLETTGYSLGSQEAMPTLVQLGSYIVDVSYQDGTPDVIAPPSGHSRLADARGRITDALAAAGIGVATTARFSAPCVLVEPGEPWAGVDLSMGRRRTAHWRLTLVAGKADSAGALDTLMDLVDQVDTALLTIQGCELPTWARPFDSTLDGAQYAASAATVKLLTRSPSEVEL